jgi:predicted adenylyl cyclase CyaB
MKNLELKSIFSDLDHAKKICKEINARYSGILNQTDTFFNVKPNRLKLRNINNKKLELIYYYRTNGQSEKISEYEIIRLKEEGSLKKILKNCLGIKSVVRKKRELYLFENVRIHLDTVRGLGKFLEFEIVCNNSEELKEAPGKMKELKRVFSVKKQNIIGISYIDLIINKN